MSRKVSLASFVAVAISMITALVATDSSGAAAQDKAPVIVAAQPVSQFTSAPVVQALPAGEMTPKAEKTDASATTASSLQELVAAQSIDGELSDEMNCLAGAIYFEAKSESLEGQLAVGRVVINRSKSGRFPGSYCGVVFQPSQFSFVRGKHMPAINKDSRDWREAVAIAKIADADAWESSVEGALFFHANYVSPNWRLKRVARVDNHIFYR